MRSKTSISSKSRSISSSKSGRKDKSLSRQKVSKNKGALSITSWIDDDDDDDAPVDYINYREELTYLFFKSAVEHIIESRDTNFQIISEEIETSPETHMNMEGDKDSSILLSQKSKFSKSGLKSNKSKSNTKPVKLTKDDTESKDTESIISIRSITKNKYSISNVDSSTSTKSLNYVRKKSKVDKKTFEWIEYPKNSVERIVFKNGNIYEGQTYKWLMDGKGTYFWSDGSIYKGDFKDGHPDGKGKIQLRELSTYEGDFSRGFFHGLGVFCISSTPSIYKGSWKNGKKHGYGWLLYDKDDWYEGGWFENKKQGIGYRQYKNYAKFNGMWFNDEKNGEGSITWGNSDIYTGEWKDNKPHGYGEYTWSAVFTKHFVFPYCNSYKGSWVDGLRTGVGLMNFGTECGAKLVGMWNENEKNGPGIMICGNGLTVQCNPLFLNDKPVHLNMVKFTASELDRINALDNEQVTEKSVTTLSNQAQHQEMFDEKTIYRKIIGQIKSQVPFENLDVEILKMITQNGLNIDEKQYIILDQSNVNTAELYCPLNLPIHTVAEDVDLEYYMDTIYDYFSNVADGPEISRSFQSEKLNNKNTRNSRQIKVNNRISEEKLIRNIITTVLPKLTLIYDQYATIMTGEKHIKFKVVLIRLFLWQLLRDIELPRKGVSLVEVDAFIAKNPKCCLETDQNPFEMIYFWQFIQALLGCAWLLHISKKNQPTAYYNSGSISHIFRDFLELHVFPNAGNFIGTCLTEHKDLIPINCVYSLYLKIGEPHSVFDFLYFTCTKEGKNPPCYAAIDDGDERPEIKDGKNVTIGDKAIYLEAAEDVIPRISRRSVPKMKHIDIFKKTLFIFRSLGRRKIIHLLHKICPPIISNGKLHLDYKLTFLEFYEVILLCAREKAEEKTKIIEEPCRKSEIDPVPLKNRTSSNQYKIEKQKKKINRTGSSHI